ncbi:MAG: IS481 family transposase [Actinomycetota bacterium]
MDLASYIVQAVQLEGRSYREVAAAYGVSKSWVGKILARYRAGGEQAIRARPKAAERIANRTPAEVEDRIVALRKQLADQGFDDGAQTIHYHLSRQDGLVPSARTIHRILVRRGFVTPQPRKRPRSSFIRFEASLPNECWQSDVTHWRLADETEVEIINFIDDHSRLCLASRVHRTTTARIALSEFSHAAQKWGYPAALLTDNGCIYTAAHRGGRAALESELLARGIVFKHSRPYHPQTCGKVERFHQTLKGYLAKQEPPASIAELQRQVDRFIAYYNDVRPHRARGRMTPHAAYDARDKARPDGPKISVGIDTRIRHDVIDPGGKVTLRYKSKLHHIGVGREHHGKRVIILRAGLDVRVLGPGGEHLRGLTLDPDKNYQATGRKYSPKGRKLGPRRKKPSTMP